MNIKKQIINILLFTIITCVAIIGFAASANSSHIAWKTYNNSVFTASKKEKRPVLMFFEADWCPHCRTMKGTTLASPSVIKMINENYIPVMVDIDKNKDIAQQYYVMKLPTFLVLDGNQKAIDSFVGELSIVDFMGKLSDAYHEYKTKMN